MPFNILIFRQLITDLYNHREQLQEMAENCSKKQQELSWENKAKQMVELYQKALSKNETT